MPDFDAELYLRVLGEDGLLGRDDGRHAPWDSPALGAARALVAGRAIDAGDARAVIEDYSLASALREEGLAYYESPTASPPAAAAKPLEPFRVWACEHVLE